MSDQGGTHMSETARWAVVDYDGNLKPDRWETRDEAEDLGLCGKYLLSGFEVVEVPAETTNE